ncbi:hypothetical protein Tco_0073131 [Tanacetum coccineum]
MEWYDRENVVLDDFSPMVTLESHSNVTSPRSKNLSTSNHVSLDSRHWNPSSGSLRSGLCLYAFLGNALQGYEATHGSEALECEEYLITYLMRERETSCSFSCEYGVVIIDFRLELVPLA